MVPISLASRGVRDPVDRTSSADPFADHGIPSFAQPSERRPRRVREPSRSLGQIDDRRAVGALQMFDHQRQLAAIARSGRSSRVTLVRTGDILRLPLSRLAELDRVSRVLVDGDGFQTGRSQFERVTLSSVIATPDRRSRFRLNLAGQTKLRKFDADLAESRPLDRCQRRQATVLALSRSAHHHKLCVGKFDTHDPTLPIVLEARVIRASPGRAPDRSVPMGRLGHAGSPRGLPRHQCFLSNEKPVLPALARKCSEWPDKQLCVPRDGTGRSPSASQSAAFRSNQT